MIQGRKKNRCIIIIIIGLSIHLFIHCMCRHPLLEPMYKLPPLASKHLLSATVYIQE